MWPLWGSLTLRQPSLSTDEASIAAVESIGRAAGIEPRPARADATHDLYERYSRQVFGFCVNQLGSRDEAEDAVQSTFLNAHRALQRGVTPEAELAWLFKIAHNVCLTRRRSTRRRGRVEAASDLQSMQDVIPAPSRENADELIRLTDALAHMPDNQRRAILLREWQGLSYHEIADELGLSQSAVETLIFRARRSLASNLETEPERSGLVARAKAMIDLGSLLMAAKTIFGTGTAVKAAATAVAVSGAAVIATAPMTPAPAAAAKHEQALAPIVAAESTSAAAQPRDASIASASALAEPPKATTARQKPARGAAEASASVASPTSVGEAPAEPQATPPASDPAPAPVATAPKPDSPSGKDKSKDTSPGPPAQIAPVEQPKTKPKPPQAGNPGNGKPQKPKKDDKAGKPADPPPAAITPTPIAPIETLPAPLADAGATKDSKSAGNGHKK